MEELIMDPTIEAIKKDLSAAIESFEQDKFKYVRSVGVWMIDNLAIAKRKELIIYGLFIQEVGEEFIAIKRRNEDELEPSKEIGTKFIKNLIFTIDEKDDIKKVWDFYFKFKKEIFNYNKSELELLIYKGEDVKFTHQCTSMLIEHLNINKELLLEENNGLLYGIINEQLRLINLYGFETRDLLFYLMLGALIRYYLMFFEVEIKNGKESEQLSDKIYPFVERFLEIITPENVEFDEKCNELIGDILYQNSIYVLNYLGGVKTRKNKERDDKEDKMKLIPKKSRERIGKVIEKAIEKEVSK